MPIDLGKSITVQPPAATASKLWAKQIVIRMAPGAAGVASCDLVPVTDAGTAVERDADGSSLVETVHCPSIMGYIESGNCPTLAATMSSLIASIEEIRNENARLAAIEAEAAE